MSSKTIMAAFDMAALDAFLEHHVCTEPSFCELVYDEPGFPHKEWDKFPGFWCSMKKTMEEFKQAWIECGAYDPVNKVWSEEKMNRHLHELYHAECGLAKCLERLRNSGQL